MSARPLTEWADIVAELATRRGREWQERLRRPIEYDREKLRQIAVAATRCGVLDDETALKAVESGFLALEISAGWQQEWNLRNRVVRGHA